MEVTRNVILDLLPLYLAGETSPDTAALVESYLKTDPELARLAQQMDRTGLAEVPVPLSRETALETYVKATQQMLFRTLAWSALAVAAILGSIVFVLYFVVGLR
jgi:anti-sigma factor RsiW